LKIKKTEHYFSETENAEAPFDLGLLDKTGSNFLGSE